MSRNPKRITVIGKKAVKTNNINSDNFKPYSYIFLLTAGVILAGMGLYFCFVRPPLLPEDILYMGSLSQTEKDGASGLVKWLQKVFWVMGGYIFTVGLLTVFISITSFRHRRRGVFSIMCLAGISSIGLMTIVNFIIASDFRWLLFSFTGLWAFALLLYRLHK